MLGLGISRYGMSMLEEHTRMVYNLKEPKSI